ARQVTPRVPSATETSVVATTTEPPAPIEPVSEVLHQPPAAEEVVMTSAEEDVLLGGPQLDRPIAWTAECLSLEELRLSLVALEIDLDTAEDHKKPDLAQQIQQLQAAVVQREKEGSANQNH
uniref:Uncharacterized protein n=1 Tax=Romanomermis culicivorax TaxID=13658 RepID=A0A915IH82_ROMCU